MISGLRFRIDIINADIYQIYLYLQVNHVKYQASSYPATKLTNARLFSNKHLPQQEIYPSPRIPSRKPITQAQWLKFLDSYTRYVGKPSQSLRYYFFFPSPFLRVDLRPIHRSRVNSRQFWGVALIIRRSSSFRENIRRVEGG